MTLVLSLQGQIAGLERALIEARATSARLKDERDWYSAAAHDDQPAIATMRDERDAALAKLAAAEEALAGERQQREAAGDAAVRLQGTVQRERRHNENLGQKLLAMDAHVRELMDPIVRAKMLEPARSIVVQVDESVELLRHCNENASRALDEERQRSAALRERSAEHARRIDAFEKHAIVVDAQGLAMCRLCGPSARRPLATSREKVEHEDWCPMKERA